MPFTEQMTSMAIGLARELPSLRPSQQREISQRLDSPDQVWVFAKAVELALQAVCGESDELIERVYLLGLDVRQMFDARPLNSLHLAGRWENMPLTIAEAFAGGFRRDPFEVTLAAARSVRSRGAGDAQPVSGRSYEISDADVVAIFHPEDLQQTAN